MKQPPNIKNQPASSSLSSQPTPSGQSYAAITAKAWQPGQPQIIVDGMTTSATVTGTQPTSVQAVRPQASTAVQKPTNYPVAQHQAPGGPPQGAGQTAPGGPAVQSTARSPSGQNQNRQTAKLQASQSATDVSTAPQKSSKPTSSSVGELSGGNKDQKEKEKECSMM
jgi:hypothetical protein